jgi:hypothetical protein
VSGAARARGWTLTTRSGPVVLVTCVRGAVGSRAIAAALACAASEPERAALLIDLDASRTPRSSLVATTGARDLEERVAAHMPEASVASRGQVCHLKLSPDSAGIEQLPAALPLSRESAAVILLPPSLLQPLLADPRIQPTAALLRADLTEERALTALAARDLIDRGLRVAVSKRPLGWLAARCALFGVLSGVEVFPARTRERLLDTEDSKLRRCYDGKDEAEGDRQATSRRAGKRFAPAQRRFNSPGEAD